MDSERLLSWLTVVMVIVVVGYLFYALYVIFH